MNSRPNNNIPDRRLPSNKVGYFNGNSTASIISFRTVSNPPTSSHRTLGNDVDDSGRFDPPPPPPLPDERVNDRMTSRSASRDCNTDTGESFSLSSSSSFFFKQYTNFCLMYIISFTDIPFRYDDTESNVASILLSQSTRA